MMKNSNINYPMQSHNVSSEFLGIVIDLLEEYEWDYSNTARQIQLDVEGDMDNYIIAFNNDYKNNGLRVSCFFDIDIHSSVMPKLVNFIHMINNLQHEVIFKIKDNHICFSCSMEADVITKENIYYCMEILTIKADLYYECVAGVAFKKFDENTAILMCDTPENALA